MSRRQGRVNSSPCTWFNFKNGDQNHSDGNCSKITEYHFLQWWKFVCRVCAFLHQWLACQTWDSDDQSINGQFDRIESTRLFCTFYKIQYNFKTKTKYGQYVGSKCRGEFTLQVWSLCYTKILSSLEKNGFELSCYGFWIYLIFKTSSNGRYRYDK